MLSFAFMSAQASMWENDEEGEDDEIEFEEGIIDKEPTHHVHHKTPILRPHASYSHHVLIFKYVHPEYELRLVQNGIVVYSTIVTSSQQHIQLPAMYTGACDIMLIQGNFVFLGCINL